VVQPGHGGPRATVAWRSWRSQGVEVLVPHGNGGLVAAGGGAGASSPHTGG
jgi:hypothetical protein